VARGSDWLILPFAPGVPLDWGDPAPANLFDTLAALHARYHGDVHPGNVLVDPVLDDPVLDDPVLDDPGAGRATLIDWGSSRVGPAALDLANLVTADSAHVARYAATWRERTGQPLPAETVELGYRWAALQIPVQYLPWIAGHQSTSEVEACLDRIERALAELREA
jgi:aminoglycoside phosphotransferase (APT) family kinase protein